jgi:histone deacetylase 11
MKLSHEAVNRRDLTVLEAVRGRGIPLLVLSSGGYSKTSARLIADFVLGAYRYEKNR